jgi:DNA-binding IclR family transcriptional regulator
MPASDYGTINAIRRAMGVLEHLSAARHGLSVTELASASGLSKATVFRILASLQSAGYVEQDPQSQLYRLTLRIASLAFAFIDTMGFEDICQPYLADLARETGELVQLAVVQGDDMIFVAKAEGTQRVKLVPMLGRRVTLNASAAGKVWLASLPEEEAIRIVLKQGLPRLTGQTLATIDANRAEWARVRQQGYAMTIQEYWDDVNSVGAPIRVGASRRVVAGITIAGPSSRFTPEIMHALVPRLVTAADTIARTWPAWAEPLAAVAGETPRSPSPD